MRLFYAHVNSLAPALRKALRTLRYPHREVGLRAQKPSPVPERVKSCGGYTITLTLFGPQGTRKAARVAEKGDFAVETRTLNGRESVANIITFA